MKGVSFRGGLFVRFSCGLFLMAAAYGTAVEGRAQDTILYFRFHGQITRLPPGGNTGFPGVQVGDPINGLFQIDISAPDQNPANDRQGVFNSASFVFDGTIGSHSFGIAPSPQNSLVVDLSLAESPQNFVVLRGSNNVSLTFFDGTGQTIFNDSIPTSEAVYNAFPSFDYFSFEHGQYLADVTVTQVPEPGALALVGVGLLTGVALRRSRP